MNCTVENKEITDIQATNILPQTPFWATIKNMQGYLPMGFQLAVSNDLLVPSDSHTQTVKDDLLVLIKYLGPDRCFAYVPYGPKIEPRFEHHGIFLETLSEVLRPHLPSDCVFIRFDLLWENQWAYEKDRYDHNGDWTGPPPGQIQEFRINFNTLNWNLQKSPRDFLPKNTFFLNLTEREEDLLYRMRYNTRYNIRRAFRKGVQVREYGIEMIDEWYALYCDTAYRNKLTLYPKSYFSTLLTSQKANRGIKVSLIMAEYEGTFVASMFLVLSHRRGTYLFGASSTAHKELMAGYALQWVAITKAKHSGCHEYDMFGCAPNLDRTHPLHGVHLYKKGFGGKLYHRMGCWDYPLSEKEYTLIRAYETQN